MAMRRSTKIWVILPVVGVLLCVLGGALNVDPFVPLGLLLIFLSAGAFFWRGLGFLGRKLFYRLSWRLAFSYFLIGVFPIPLLALLLGGIATISVGQFEAYRVGRAIDRMALEMAAGEVPATLRARVAAGTVKSSTIPALPAGAAVPDWLRELDGPRFIRGDGPVSLAVARKHGDATEVFALPLDDILLAGLAERSGVAVQRVSVAARPVKGGRNVGLEVKVSPNDRERLRRQPENFVYPPEATPADQSGSLLKSVSWAYTSAPVLGPPVEANRNFVLLFTRMSWRHALSDLFAQGIVRGRQNNWALTAFVVIACMLLLVYLVALLIAFVLVLTITRTANRLTRATRKIAAGDFSVRIATKARDQIGDLARSFDSMASSLESTVRDRTAREFLDREIEQARLIAQKLLPPEGASVAGLTTATYFDPVARMGGDYYDFLRTADGRTAVAVGDVSGHGLPTALLVAMAKSALATLLETGEEGIPLFEKLNGLMHRSTDSRNYMTLAVLVVGGDGRASLTNAGHPAPYLISDGEVRPLSLPAFPLGIWPRADFATEAFPFRPGDRLVFYTDGIIETCDASDEPFGFERFEEIVRQNAAVPLADLQRTILAAVEAHGVGRDAADDRTLVIVERA